MDKFGLCAAVEMESLAARLAKCVNQERLNANVEAICNLAVQFGESMESAIALYINALTNGSTWIDEYMEQLPDMRVKSCFGQPFAFAENQSSRAGEMVPVFIDGDNATLGQLLGDDVWVYYGDALMHAATMMEETMVVHYFFNGYDMVLPEPRKLTKLSSASTYPLIRKLQPNPNTQQPRSYRFVHRARSRLRG